MNWYKQARIMICPICKGTGKPTYDPNITCEMCEGTGQREYEAFDDKKDADIIDKKIELTPIQKQILKILHFENEGSGLLASDLVGEIEGSVDDKRMPLLFGNKRQNILEIRSGLNKLKTKGLVGTFLGTRGNRQEVRLYEKTPLAKEMGY